MPTTPLRALAAALLALGTALALIAAPTHAAPTRSTSEVIKDQRGDVRRMVPGERGARYVAVPRNRDTDIVRATVHHTAQRVQVRVTLRQLRRNGHRVVGAEIRTSGGIGRDLALDYSREPLEDRIALTRVNQGKSLACEGLRWNIDRATRTLRFSVPRSCLGNPRWVRVGVAAISLTANGGDYRILMDDARGARLDVKRLRLGPRLFRAA